MCSDIEEKPADLRMKNDDQRQNPYSDKLSHDRTDQLHVEGSENHPKKINDKKAHHDVKSHSTFNKAIDLEQ